MEQNKLSYTHTKMFRGKRRWSSYINKTKTGFYERVGDKKKLLRIKKYNQKKSTTNLQKIGTKQKNRWKIRENDKTIWGQYRRYNIQKDRTEIRVKKKISKK